MPVSVMAGTGVLRDLGVEVDEATRPWSRARPVPLGQGRFMVRVGCLVHPGRLEAARPGKFDGPVPEPAAVEPVGEPVPFRMARVGLSTVLVGGLRWPAGRAGR